MPGRLHLLLRGTNFQIKVWEALLNVGSSRLVSYKTLARLAGSPKAHRSVGTALAGNRIALLIPCHRVIREDGEIGTYHWGSDRKAAMVAWEAAQAIPAPSFFGFDPPISTYNALHTSYPFALPIVQLDLPAVSPIIRAHGCCKVP